ncbi:MAG: transporter permease subunit [Clostridia bacterium]|nr:transporter permease subunit [Clostridia bacterium]
MSSTHKISETISVQLQTNKKIGLCKGLNVKNKKLKQLDETNWKPYSIFWQNMQVFIYIAAFIINLMLPTVQEVEVTIYRIFLGIVILFLIVRYRLTSYSETIKAKNNHEAQLYFAIGVIISIWDIVTTKFNILPLPFFPSFAQILQVMREDYITLLVSTAYSLRLLVIGFTVGTVTGLVTGILIGWYKQWNYWLLPIIKIMGVIPAVAWIPVLMFIFPSSFYAQIFLIVLCVWFPVAYMTCSGIQNIQKSYFEAARTLGANESYLVFKIAIPGAMPSIFTGIYTATGVSFATLIVSEMIGAKAGLGWYINWAKGWSNYAKVYASIIVMAIIFSLVMAVIYKMRDKVLIWQKGLLK